MAGTAVMCNGTAILGRHKLAAVLDEQRDETRDEAIVEALVAGKSVRVVQREFRLTLTELDQALERCFPLDTAARLRTIRGDLVLLDRIIQKFYLRAMAADDAASAADDAVVAIRAQERKAQLLGLDAVQRIDLQVVKLPDAAASRERMRKAINEFIERQPAAEREAHNLVGKLGGERALELLRAGDASSSDGHAPADPAR